jgi:tetratricopeptide (TPR) repeat protein
MRPGQNPGRDRSIWQEGRMQQRVFVAMPFGKKEVRPAEAGGPEQSAVFVDFDEVFQRLMEPALRKANCEPFRADQEPAAGDIRTDMYFELVTADFVLADISILNPNVFYELGIRHGVAPRGVLTLHGGWSQRPFDVAPDRNIPYDGALFDLKGERGDAWNASVEQEVVELAERLRAAIASDPQAIGSPVYSQLVGLRPVDAGDLQTARAKYFGMELKDWRRRIAVAAKKGYAGDILTLARDAPNRMSERRIVLDAAKRLVSLRRYQPAKELLTQLLAEDPSNVTVLCELGQVEGRLGDLTTAEMHLRRAAELRRGDPEAYGMLGRVGKDLWRLRWEQQPDLAQRQRSAVQNSQLAAEAASSYDAAVRHDLGSYYNGINALGLARLLAHLRKATGRVPVRVRTMQLPELASVVRVAARGAAERVEQAGPTASDRDREDWIWATVTLGELKLLDGRKDDALGLYTRATASDALTFFQVESIQTQLRMYEGLALQPDITRAVLDVLEESKRNLPTPGGPFDKVVVGSGHMIDKPGRRSPRFPPSAEDAVRQRMEAVLERWRVGEGDLAICGGARGSDTLFAEICVRRGATVRLYLPLPRGDFLRESVRLPGTDWEQRFDDLSAVCETSYQDERLGPPPAHLDVFARNNLWQIDTARVEAVPGKLHVVLVWDGNTGDGPGGTADFAEVAHRLDARLEIIHPLGG